MDTHEARNSQTRRVSVVRRTVIGTAAAGSVGLAAVLGLHAAGTATAATGTDSSSTTTTSSSGSSSTSNNSGLVSSSGSSTTSQATSSGS